MSLPAPDVDIVGAGIIGLAIGWRLARAGARVRIMDAHSAGSGASHAAAGMLSAGWEFEKDVPSLNLAQVSRMMYPEFIEYLSADADLPIDFAECGAIERPENDAQWNALVSQARRQQELGIACEIQDGEIFFPGDATVNPRDVLAALRRACILRNVEILENQPVKIIDAHGPITVIAAGCWSGAIRIVHEKRSIELPDVTPVKGHLIGYFMPAGSLPHILRCGATYILQRSNGFTIAGSTLERVGFDTRVDPSICHAIHQRASRLWPALRDRAPVECWTGLRPEGLDGQAAIGQVRETSIWLAYGHYRNGVLLAPITAELIASGIMSSPGTD